MTNATRWGWIISLVAITGTGLVLAFLLVLATDHGAIYERHYIWLFWINVGIATALGLVIGLALVRLLVRLWRGKFGSKLLLKLAGIFGLVAVVPGLLIYLVSYQFVTRSIESWFDVRVEHALDAGLVLGRSTLEASTRELSAKAKVAADRIAETEGVPQPIALERLREQLAVHSLSVLGNTGSVLASAGSETAEAQPNFSLSSANRYPETLLRQVRSHGVVSSTEGLDDEGADNDARAFNARVRAIAWVPSGQLSLSTRDRYVVVTQALPAPLVRNALAVQSAYREYQQRALSRGGLRRMYVGTLTLALALATFGAVLLAATLGHQLAHPLLLLAEGVDEVAHGDLRPKAVFASHDELGGLTRAFANMTAQLDDARAQIQHNVAELDSARAHLQTILDSLTAGVIVFDSQGRIEMVNPGATRILRLPLSAWRGKRLQEIPQLADFARSVAERFAQQASGSEAGERAHWQESYQLRTDLAHEPLTLLVRGASLPDAAQLMVFDDITEVASVQRSQAWGEVARRVAHEIKNPLTPIQLSAQRLQHKLESKLDPADQQILARSVDTIVNQVQAMKRLVNEFRDYARLPTAHLVPCNLNQVVAEVLVLYASHQEAGRLVSECASDLPWIEGDASLLRQVIHNLVQNALDAIEAKPGGQVRISTRAKHDEYGAVRAVRLAVADNGPGFPDKILKCAFEPYVTTKSKGTGLGLAVVKKIADEHGAVVRLSNLQEATNNEQSGTTNTIQFIQTLTGAQVSLSFSKLSQGGAVAAPLLQPSVATMPPSSAASGT